MRTVEIAQAGQGDVTSDYASVGVLSILEPLLGIINRSLPLLRPVLQYFLDKLGWVRIEGKSSSRPSFLPSIGSKRARPQVHDPYPLDTLATVDHASQTKIWKSTSAGDSESVKDLMKDDQHSHSIVVKRDWDVNHSRLS